MAFEPESPAARPGAGVSDAFGRVLAEERRENARQMNAFRFQALNVAAHIEQLTKRNGTPIPVSEATRARVHDVSFRAAGALDVSGKSQPIECYEPAAPAPLPVDRARPTT